jgi:hypothetical protein
MNDRMKQMVDRIMFAADIAAIIMFAFGMIFSVGALARIGLWMIMLVTAGIAGMQTYEFLCRSNDDSREKLLLIQMIAAVLVALLFISLSIFFLNGKIITLP